MKQIIILLIFFLHVQLLSQTHNQPGNNSLLGLREGKGSVNQNSRGNSNTSSDLLLAKERYSMLDAIIPDFRVDQPDDIPDYENVINDFVIVWCDDMNIRALRYSGDGSPLGNSFIVNEYEGNTYQGNPSFSTDEVGNFIITWEDKRNGNRDIYAQRYSNLGEPLGSNFKVNDDESTFDQRTPCISSDRKGNFIVTWQDYRYGYTNIFAQMFTSEGIPTGENFKVNDDEGNNGQSHPSVSIDGKGNFIITWTDYRNGNYDIYSQRYLIDSTPLGVNVRVNDDEANADQMASSVVADNSGDFMIAWKDLREGTPHIYAQKYLNDGSPDGVNSKVSEAELDPFWIAPSICASSKGVYLITWSGKAEEDFDIFAQIYSREGNKSGTNIRVNEDFTEGNQRFPSVFKTGLGDLIISWRDGGSNYAQRYSPEGIAKGTNFQLDEQYARSFITRNSSISVDDNGNFVITWAESRNDKPGIYYRQYSSYGSPVGDNLKVNTDTGEAYGSGLSGNRFGC